MQRRNSIRVMGIGLAIALIGGGLSLPSRAAVVAVADTNNAAQNREDIQDQLDLGNVVELDQDDVYEIDARLVITEPDSGIQSESTTNPATIQFVPTTANEVVAGARSSAYGSVIFVNEVQNGPTEEVVIRDLLITRTHDDNTFVRTIDIYGSAHVSVHNVEIEDFSLGGMVTIASSDDVSVTDCDIHDCTASAGTQDNPPRIQVTGIEVDEERDADVCGAINSSNIYLAHNRIVDLTGQNDQSDGINIQGEGTGAQVINNYIDTVGEGIDLFCDQAIVKHNIIRNGAIFGIKIIHGASENMLHNNIVTTEDEGTLANVILSGAELAHLGNTFGNFFSHSSLEGALGFTVQRSSVQTGGAPRYNFCFVNDVDAPEIDPAHVQIIDSEYNKFLNSGLAAESEEEAGLDGNLIASDMAFVRTGDFDGQLGIDLFAYKSDGTNVQYYRRAANGAFGQASNNITPGDIDNADNFLVGRFDDGLSDDLVFHWKSSGENRFYTSDADSTYTDLGELITDTLIDNNPTSMLVGDFDANGRADLFFHWKGDGTNWMFINSAMGAPSFTARENEISTGGVNGNPDQLVAGDFNGDGKTDLYFYWKSTGGNRLYLKSTDYTFYFPQDNPIGVSHLSGGTENLIVDDFNEDGFDDVMAYFPNASGGPEKRLFLSNGDGSFPGTPKTYLAY